jgi:hypothetical protein
MNPEATLDGQLKDVTKEDIKLAKEVIVAEEKAGIPHPGLNPKNKD